MTATPEIPGYDVWGLLGEGGMSQVWLAKHRALAVPVIVKTLRAAMTDALGTNAAAKILSEARLTARVSSPRIVRALDAGTIPGTTRPFLVQEYVDGLDLAELDARRRQALGLGLPLGLVCHVMHEVCTGLRAAHQAGVIHRDLKPSNVFGAPDSGIRLGDFGIAVARGDAGSPDTAGTLSFMAPEQLRGQPLGRFSDVWGAGATAYDLRYGQSPFASVEEILDPARPPRFPVPETPAEAYFQQLLRAMLEKDVARRPSDLFSPLQGFAMLLRAIPLPPLQVRRESDATLLAGPVTVRFRDGDIAEAQVDAIVSSASYEMHMQAGVGAALCKRGGRGIEEEAMRGGERPLGSCVRTGPGTLAAKHVFHAVSAWNEVSCIARAFARALLLSDEHGCTSLAVPALGTGAGRVGLEASASALATTLRWHLQRGGSRLREITVWLDSDEKKRLFHDVAAEVFGVDEYRTLDSVDVGLPTGPKRTDTTGNTLPDPARAKTELH